MTYDEFFTRATGRTAFPYQRALALADRFPEALCAPTGSGKTAAVVLGWLYRRRLASDAERRATPRRLVICLGSLRIGRDGKEPRLASRMVGVPKGEKRLRVLEMTARIAHSRPWSGARPNEGAP